MNTHATTQEHTAMSNLKNRVRQATGNTGGDGDAQPGGEVAVKDPRLAWLERGRDDIVRALPRHINEDHFIQAALTGMEKLRNCDIPTIWTALMACARFGLAPDGVRAAIVPYGKTATFVPMYQGLIDVMHRSGMVESVRVGFIREQDAWEYTPSAPSPADFHHKPAVELPREERGDVILAYAFAWLRGGARSQVVLLNRQEAIEIRDLYSRAYAYHEKKGTRESTWHTHFDQQWAKSCVRRLAKHVPTSPEVSDLLHADTDADDGIQTLVAEVERTDQPARTGDAQHEHDPQAGERQEIADWPETARPGDGVPPRDAEEG
ncbi:recombinase RecT [Streptomyces synnematoformans]|uniref:Recombinase RecT n=1 Tax=Streptomyces synnematoformans TaxID=415721 RepID=A0ABN2X925_9ACTN